MIKLIDIMFKWISYISKERNLYKTLKSKCIAGSVNLEIVPVSALFFLVFFLLVFSDALKT